MGMRGFNAQHKAAAGAAIVKAEHQAGVVARAAPEARPEAERAVITIDGGDAPLGHREQGVPDQRAVGEYPDAIRRRLAAAQRALQRALQLLVAPGQTGQLAFEVGVPQTATAQVLAR